MDVEKTVKKIAKEYDKKVASDMRRAAIEQAAKTGLQKLRAAEKISSMTGMTTAEVLLSNLLELYPDGAIPAEEAKALIVPALKHNYDYVSPIVEEAHQQINKEAGIGLKPVVPEFDRNRAEGIAANLAKAENIADHAEALEKQIENQSRNIVDSSIQENAKAHTRAGLEVKVIRKYDGIGVHNRKDPCPICEPLDGEWSYSDAIAKGVFRRHPGCGCEILYRSQKGWERQKEWTSNQWEDIPDKRTIRMHRPINNERTGIAPEERIATIPQITNITGEYLQNASPGIGSITKEPGYIDKDHQEENDFAKWLYNALGGTIIQNKDSKTKGKHFADFTWNGKLWELKTISSSKYNTIDQHVRDANKQIASNRGGFFIDISSSKLSIDEMAVFIETSMKRRSIQQTDVLIKRKELFEIKRIR